MIEQHILIMGGGLAGLTAAIHLTLGGHAVTVIEKSPYPRHKVCGEYISNETLPYLKTLGVDPMKDGAIPIDTFNFTHINGKNFRSSLPLGGYGISRFKMDALLFEKARDLGCTFVFDRVIEVRFEQGLFYVETANEKTFKAGLVIGAHGKRSNLDVSLSRKFAARKSPWLAIKAHYTCDIQENEVALHNFKGGYCGISKVEDDAVNVCYLATYESFKNYRDITTYQDQVLCENPYLRDFFATAKMTFKKPLTIGQVSFDNKELVKDHILMCGDSAALIHPLCGNGMAMAIMGARLLSKTIIKHYNLGTLKREKLEADYQKAWKKEFYGRLRAGRMLQSVFQNETLSGLTVNVAKTFPTLIPKVISLTHGKP